MKKKLVTQTLESRNTNLFQKRRSLKLKSVALRDFNLLNKIQFGVSHQIKWLISTNIQHSIFKNEQILRTIDNDERTFASKRRRISFSQRVAKILAQKIFWATHGIRTFGPKAFQRRPCCCCCCWCCCCCVLRNQNQTASTLSFDSKGANLLCRSRITLDAECCQKLLLIKEKKLG